MVHAAEAAPKWKKAIARRKDRKLRPRQLLHLVLAVGRSNARHATVAYFGLATPITPHAIRAPALPTGWPPSSTLA